MRKIKKQRKELEALREKHKDVLENQSLHNLCEQIDPVDAPGKKIIEEELVKRAKKTLPKLLSKLS